LNKHFIGHNFFVLTSFGFKISENLYIYYMSTICMYNCTIILDLIITSPNWSYPYDAMYWAIKIIRRQKKVAARLGNGQEYPYKFRLVKVVTWYLLSKGWILSFADQIFLYQIENIPYITNMWQVYMRTTSPTDFFIITLRVSKTKYNLLFAFI
jgi:hypothetical protein